MEPLGTEVGVGARLQCGVKTGSPGQGGDPDSRAAAQAAHAGLVPNGP